jgi:hypothetical protein
MAAHPPLQRRRPSIDRAHAPQKGHFFSLTEMTCCSWADNDPGLTWPGSIRNSRRPDCGVRRCATIVGARSALCGSVVAFSFQRRNGHPLVPTGSIRADPVDHRAGLGRAGFRSRPRAGHAPARRIRRRPGLRWRGRGGRPPLWTTWSGKKPMRPSRRMADSGTSADPGSLCESLGHVREPQPVARQSRLKGRSVAGSGTPTRSCGPSWTALSTCAQYRSTTSNA